MLSFTNHRFAVFGREILAIPVVRQREGAFGRSGPDCFPFCVSRLQRFGLYTLGRNGNIAATAARPHPAFSIAVATV
jgi:hypothetical protein